MLSGATELTCGSAALGVIAAADAFGHRLAYAWAIGGGFVAAVAILTAELSERTAASEELTGPESGPVVCASSATTLAARLTGLSGDAATLHGETASIIFALIVAAVRVLRTHLTFGSTPSQSGAPLQPV